MGENSLDSKSGEEKKIYTGLNSWIFEEEVFLKHSPSRKVLTIEQELKTREGLHDFIIRLGTSLKIDGRSIYAASVYVNRFYMLLPITTSKYFVASAAVAISCKLYDNYRQPGKIALAACKIKNPKKEVDEQSSLFWQWRDQLLYREELILKNLNFDLVIDFPYSLKEELLTLEGDKDDFFYQKFPEILKQCVSFIEILSSLPVLMSYNYRIIFGTAMVLITSEAREMFKQDVHVPKKLMSDNLKIEAEDAFKCYNYISTLLDYCKSDDPLLDSHRMMNKRFKRMSKEAFMEMIKDR